MVVLVAITVLMVVVVVVVGGPVVVLCWLMCVCGCLCDHLVGIECCVIV